MSLERPLDPPDSLAFEPGLRPLSGVDAGTEVLSRRGYIRAADLKPGEDVITRDRGLCRILSITRVQARSRVVRFASHALGEDCPDRAVILPARQAVLVRDWRALARHDRHAARVAAISLIDGILVTDAGMTEGDWLQIWLDAPSVLYLRGLEVVSAHGFDDRMHPKL